MPAVEGFQQAPPLITVSAPETPVTDGLGSANLIVQAGRRGGEANRLVGSMVDAKAFDLGEVGQVPGSEREYAEEQHDIALATLQTGEDDDSSVGSEELVIEDISLDANCIFIDDSGGGNREKKQQAATAAAAEAAAAAAEAAAAKEFQGGGSSGSSEETPDTAAEDADEEDDEDMFGTIMAGTQLDFADPLERQQQQQSSHGRDGAGVEEAEIDRAVQRCILKSIRNTTVLSTHSKKQTMLGVSRPLHSLFTFDSEHSEQLDLDLQDLLDFQI